MDEYPCLYCGGHPRLGVPEPTEATVTVGYEDIVIRIADGQARVPLHAIGGLEEQPVAGRKRLRSTVTIAINRGEDLGETGFKIILQFTNEFFAKALALRLRLAVAPIR